MHKLLARQLRRHLGADAVVPESLQNVLAAIDAAYVQADVDRALSERSLELTSQELVSQNRQLLEKTRALEAIIEEQKSMETRLRLADRMASLGTLAAGVAHEINNPLAAVAANLDALAELVARRAPDGTAHELARELREPLAEAIEGAGRIRAMVRDLKGFSRGDDEKRGPVDVRKALDAAIGMAANEVRHRARLVKQYGAVPFVDASEARLGQVFLNLVVNAAQAIPEGRANLNEIRVVTRLDGDRVVVEIRDTGCGMPAEVLGRVFDPFFTTKAIGAGTGLGLSICHSIVSALGGEISVESEVGKGTVFRVILRAADPPSVRSLRSSSPASEPTGRRGRVLIVDDDPLVGRSLVRALASEHDVVLESNARAALLRVAAGERFDVILCDLMMPELTGMDVHAELSASAPGQAERIVFLTGGAFTPQAIAFCEYVSNRFFEKPFELRELRALVRTFVTGALSSPPPTALSQRP